MAKLKSVLFAVLIPSLVSGTSFNVITFNTWLLKIPIDSKGVELFDAAKDTNDRIKLIPAKVAETGADIVSLQEVWGSETRQKLINGFERQGYTHFAYREDLPIVHQNTFDKIEHSFTRIFFRWLELTPAELAQIKKNVGNGLLVASKFEVSPFVDQLTFSVYTRPDEIFSIKGAIRVRIRVPEIGWIEVINTHLGAVSFDVAKGRRHPGERLKRLKQVHELLEWVEQGRTAEITLLTGDFNVHPLKYEGDGYIPEFTSDYLALVSDGYEDTFYRTNGILPFESYTFDSENNPYATAFGRQSPSAVIDYIFLRNSYKIESVQSRIACHKPIPKSDKAKYRLVKVPHRLSDHYAVLTEFRRQEREPELVFDFQKIFSNAAERAK